MAPGNFDESVGGTPRHGGLYLADLPLRLSGQFGIRNRRRGRSGRADGFYPPADENGRSVVRRPAAAVRIGDTFQPAGGVLRWIPGGGVIRHGMVPGHQDDGPSQYPRIFAAGGPLCGLGHCAVHDVLAADRSRFHPVHL